MAVETAATEAVLMDNEHTFTQERSFSDVMDRYQRDPKFKSIVELLVCAMMNHKLAPDEIRDAAYVASIRFMQLHPVRKIIYVDDTWPPPDQRGNRWPKEMDDG